MSSTRRVAWFEFAAITIATAALSAVMIFIVPQFIRMFADFDIALPLMTLLLMDISHWTIKLWFLIPLIPIGVGLFLNLLRMSGANGVGWIVSIWVLFIFAFVGAIGFMVLALLMPLVSLTSELSGK